MQLKGTQINGGWRANKSFSYWITAWAAEPLKRPEEGMQKISRGFPPKTGNNRAPRTSHGLSAKIFQLSPIHLVRRFLSSFYFPAPLIRVINI